MATNDECFLELEVEEQLFAAVVHCPFQEYENLILKLPDVNVKNASGRSLLHVAVRLGKLDWVEGLLGCGSDPSLVDTKGLTVLEVAEDMVERHPEDNNLKMILRFVRVSSRGWHKVQESAEKSCAISGDLRTVVDCKEERLDSGLLEVLSHMSRISLEMSTLQDAVKQLRNDTVTQIGDLCRRLLTSAINTTIQMGNLRQQQLSCCEEVSSMRENIQSLSTSVSSLKGSILTARGDIVLLINELSQHMVSSGVKISSIKQSLDSILADTPVMRESLDILQSNVTSLRGEVSSVGSTLGGVGENVHLLANRRESDSSEQLNSIREAVEELGQSLRGRDILLEALETSITSMAERFAPAWEENNNRCLTMSNLVPDSSHATESLSAASRPEDEAPNQTFMPRGAAGTGLEIEGDDNEYVSDDQDEYETDEGDYETDEEETADYNEALTGTAWIGCRILQTSEEMDCAQCVEAMMEKTFIFDDRYGKVEKVRDFYRVLYQRSSMTSCILAFLAHHPQTSVSIDLSSTKIERMKQRFIDHDGAAYDNGVHLNSAADFDEKRVYLGGFVERCEASMLAHFMKSLTQLTLFLAFNTMGLPYFHCDFDMKDNVHRIYTEVLRRKFSEGIHLEWYLHRALIARDEAGAEMLLIAAVPAITVKYGHEQGTALLREQIPSLLSFYEERLMPLIYRATRTL